MFGRKYVYMAPADAAEDLGDGGGDPGDGDEGGGDPPAFSWPDNWREQIAGEDEKALEQLKRYSDPTKIWNKARALESKVTSGELRDNAPFPAEGTDEEKQAWRETHGVPAEAANYELGRDMDDDEKEALSGFLDYAHSKNFGQEQVKDMVAYFYDRVEAEEQAEVEADKQREQESEDELRGKWDKDYRGNMNRIEGLTDLISGEAKEGFLDARLPDGSKIRHNPDLMNFLLDLSMAYNPASTLVPGQGGDVISSIQDELDQIDEFRRKDRKAYNTDEKMQKRERELLEALEKQQARKRA